jgi:excisionase family DNA binding protein
MEKICLVKLRKKIINPVRSQGEQGVKNQGREQAIPQQFIYSFTNNGIMNEAVSHSQERELGRALQFIAPCADNDIMPHKINQNITSGANNKTASPETVSLTLTKEQIKTIRSSSGLQSIFSGELAGGHAELNYRDEPITIKFECEPLAPVRLLMSEDVMQMLRISNGFLRTIVRDGKLKSYKVGKGRRYMLEDILAYLAENLHSHGSHQEALRAETN